MKFAYQWKDEKGVIHYTLNQEKADKAMHDGKFIELIILDEKTKDGTDRVAS